MIAVEDATWKVLNRDTFALKVKVTWHIGGGANAMDVSDRVLLGQIGPVSRSLSPFLAGFRSSGCVLTLRNDDGRFTTKSSSSYLQHGPEYYYRNKVVIEEGVLRDDGTWEYVPVFVGRIDYIRFLPGTVEIKLADDVGVAMDVLLQEDYTLSLTSGNYGLPKQINQTIGDLLVNYSYLDDSVVDIGTNGWLAFLSVARSWPLSGIVKQGVAIGAAASAVARSCMGTLVATEAGKVDVVNEYLPRNVETTLGMGWGGDYGTIAFDSSNSWGFEYLEPFGLFASEVVVSYQSSTARYRDTAVEAQVGRHAAAVDMPFCQHGSYAHWAARLIQETHSGFPYLVSFTTSGKALLVQLNDVIQVTDPQTDVAADCKVVSKEWRPEGIGLTVLRYNTESSLFASSNDWVSYGTSTWSGSDKLL